MVKSQLVELLRNFDKKEIRDCRKWLNSPYHNQRQDVIDLFEYFFSKKYLNRDKKLSKEIVFSYLFPQEEYDDAKIRQSMYFLLKAVEEFLIYNKIESEEIRNKVILAEIYREEKKLNKYASKSLEIANNLLEKEAHKDIEFHWNNYLIRREEVDFTTEHGRFDGTEKFLQSLKAFDLNYAAIKFRDLCVSFFDKNVKLNDIEKKIISVFSEYADQIDPADYPAVVIYHQLYKILQNPNDELFESLGIMTIRYKNDFNDDDKRNIFLLIINHCIRQMNSGKRQYIKEAFRFYKIGIEDQFLIENGVIDRYLFRNIVSVGVSLKEFGWVSNFIEKNQQYLEPEYKESYVNFCFGVLYYRSAKYEQAMRYLAQYEHDDILLNLNSKAMLIKMYYELEEFDTLEFLLESSKVYLRRKKGVSDNLRALYNNIIRYTSKLLRVNPYDKEKKAKLREEIQAANPLIEKQWFLERLEQL
ncbi:MAG: hypothetical protein AAF806_00965 [Bacteroidota bacterium]